MQQVGPGLGDDIDLAGGVAAVGGAVLGSQGLELGDGAGRRVDVERKVRAAVEVVGTVDRPVVEVLRPPLTEKTTVDEAPLTPSGPRWSWSVVPP